VSVWLRSCKRLVRVKQTFARRRSFSEGTLVTGRGSARKPRIARQFGSNQPAALTINQAGRSAHMERADHSSFLAQAANHLSVLSCKSITGGSRDINEQRLLVGGRAVAQQRGGREARETF